MPSILGHAADHGLTWKAYTGSSAYPVAFYRQLAGSPNIAGSDQIVADVAQLPALSMVWHDSPDDEHPVADVRLGHDKVWQAVDTVVRADRWNDTVFLLTWDDWGGFDDHVATPNVEHTPDGTPPAAPAAGSRRSAAIPLRGRVCRRRLPRRPSALVAVRWFR
jgi:phospholipase C